MLHTSDLEQILEDCSIKDEEIYGIVSGDLTQAMPYFVQRCTNAFANMTDSEEITLRLQPKAVFPAYRSALVLFKRYPVYERQSKVNFGQVASFAVGRDYHKVLSHRLTQLGEKIKEVMPGFDYAVCVDTSALADRQMAYQTGKAFYGKHHQVIVPEWGAGFSIGYLLTNLAINTSNERMESQCGSCVRCIEACPTHALEEGKFYKGKCISYMTQKKGVLSDFEKDQINHYIYGCDICLLACPFTQVEKESGAFVLRDLMELTSSSNQQIKAQWGEHAALWKGPALLKRNAQLILNNSESVCSSRTKSL